MSDSDLRPVERMLKASAARRRNLAGEPEMHRATREILRGEVRRHYGVGRRAGSGRMRWMLKLVPRVAVFVALGLCAWLLLHDRWGAGPTELALETRDAARPAEDLRGAALESPASRASEVARDREPDSDAAGRLAETVARPRPVPTAGPREVRQTADREIKSAVGADYFRSDRTGMYMGTAAAETDAPEQAGLQDGAELSVLMVAGSNGTASVRPPDGAVSPAVVQDIVLQRFTVFNEANVVRLIDSDGSTYEGMMERVDAVPASVPPVGSTRDTVAMLPARPADAAQSVSPGVMNFSVVASGTNRSLGQTVQFKGELSLTEKQVGEGRNFFSNTIQLEPGVAMMGALALEPSGAGRLQGRAVLDDGNDVRVNAVRAGP